MIPWPHGMDAVTLGIAITAIIVAIASLLTARNRTTAALAAVAFLLGVIAIVTVLNRIA